MTSSIATAPDEVESHPGAGATTPGTPARSVAHGTFSLERVYDASSAQVWKALTDPAAKSLWFGVASDQVEIIERQLDARPGGRERLKGKWGGKVVSVFDATYYDVIENERLVYCYEMYLDDRKISVSVATIQLKAQGNQTRLMVNEQGAFLDGYDDAASREHGTSELLDALGKSLGS
jgi:uncharacterized protein YndB with AHSA1/START domain